MPKRGRPSELKDYAKQMKDMIESLGGKQIGQYINSRTPVDSICPNGHSCKIYWCHMKKKGKIPCSKCYGHSPEESEKAFRKTIQDAGGKVIGEYKNSQTSIECVCIQGHKCSPTPDNAKHNVGFCQECAKVSWSTAKTNFENRIEELGGKLIGQYINAHTRVVAVCSNGHLCLPSPNAMTQGGGMCRECSSKSSKKSEQDFINGIHHQGGIVIGKYTGIRNRVACICSKDHQCFPIPDVVKRGINMCQTCSGKSCEEVAKRFKQTIESQNGIMIGEYINSITSVECVCSNGHKCMVLPKIVRCGNGMCSKCACNTKEHGKEQLQCIFEKRGYTLLSEYVNNHTSIDVQCDKLHKFSRSPGTFFSKQGGGICQICFPKHYGQSRFHRILTKLQIPFEPEMKFSPLLWRYDFNLFDLKIIIEFDGQQHFKIGQWRPTLQDLEDGQQRDRDKMDLAFHNGFRMIRFDYGWTWKHEDLISDAIWHVLQIMENDQIMLVVSNPLKYEWLQKDIKLNGECVDMGKELFSAYSFTI
jgi:hypothetical protein